MKKGLYSLLKRKSRSNLIATRNYFKVGYKDDGARFLWEAADDVPKGTKCINCTWGTV